MKTPVYLQSSSQFKNAFIRDLALTEAVEFQNTTEEEAESKLWMKMVDKRGWEGVVGSKLISKCLSHDQALSNIQHRPANDIKVSVLYSS